MAAISSAIIAGIGTAAAIHQGEQAAEEARRAGQREDQQKKKMEREKKNQTAKEKAERARDAAYARQQGSGGSQRNDTLATANAGGSTPGPQTLGGGTGKTLLGA